MLILVVQDNVTQGNLMDILIIDAALGCARAVGRVLHWASLAPKEQAP